MARSCNEMAKIGNLNCYSITKAEEQRKLRNDKQCSGNALDNNFCPQDGYKYNAFVRYCMILTGIQIDLSQFMDDTTLTSRYT